MTLLLSRGEVVRFWAKVAVGPIDQCWEWQASLRGWDDVKKYGQFVRGVREIREQGGPRNFYAHRVSWCCSRGWPLNYLTEGLKVMHDCDNPLCCNPCHLTLGVQLDNVRDMIRKGRNRNGHSWKQTPVEIAS